MQTNTQTNTTNDTATKVITIKRVVLTKSGLSMQSKPY